MGSPVFRCVRQERISIRGSVRPSVRPLRMCKNRISRLFLATMRSYTETNDQPTCFDSLLHFSFVSSVCLSVCLSLSVCLFVGLSVCRSVCLSVCLFVCLLVCLSVCLFVCSSLCLSYHHQNSTNLEF